MAMPYACSTRRSFTVEFKAKVLQWYHNNGENKHATAKYFKIDRRNLRTWLEKEADLTKVRGERKKKKKLTARKPLSRELDEAVLDYLMDERASGRPVSNKGLRMKALELAKSPRFSTIVPSDFMASPMWLKRWKKRNKISLRHSTSDAQKVPEDYHSILKDFRVSIIKSSMQHHLTPEDIVNMDQTMCRFDMVLGRTNDVMGKRSIRIVSTKATKKGFTLWH